MPALKNRRREKFAKALAGGMQLVKAYTSAGYRAKGGAAQATAKRIANAGDIMRRVGELAGAQSRSTKPAAGTARMEAGGGTVTAAGIIRELEEARQLAMKKKQPAPAVSAALGKARIAGLTGEKLNDSSEAVPDRGRSEIEAARRRAFARRLAAALRENNDRSS